MVKRRFVTGKVENHRQKWLTSRKSLRNLPHGVKLKHSTCEPRLWVEPLQSLTLRYAHITTEKYQVRAKSITESQRNFSMHSDMSDQISDPTKNETMIRHVIDTLRKTTPAIDRQFVRKCQSET